MSDFIRKRKIQLFCLAGLVLAVYGLSLGNDFVWDDTVFFIGNPVYKDFKLLTIFSSLSNGVEYLPLRDITYAVDYLLWGGSPFGFHLTSLIFFTINTLLVYRLAELLNLRLVSIRKMEPSKFVPLAAAALFAIHPINAEAVNFVTCRNVLVSGMFFFASCISFINYLESPSKKRYTLAIIFFICAMLGKATAIALPILLILTMPILFRGRFRQIALSTAPFFAISAVFFFVFKRIAASAGVISKAGLQFSVADVERKVAVASQIPFFYLKKFFLPYKFSIEYLEDFSYLLFSPKALVALAVSLAMALLAFAYRKKIPEFLLVYAWFAAALIPVLNFFATHPLLADRYAYIPVFGLSFGVATAFDRLAALRLKSMLTALLCLLLAAVSFTRSFDWRNEESLWKANIRNFPNHTRSYASLAAYYFGKGEHQKMMALLTANANVPLIDLYRNYFIGCTELLQRNHAAAKAAFQKTLAIQDGFIGALYGLGGIAEVEGDYLSAVNYYNGALTSGESDFFLQLPIIRERLQNIQSKRIAPYISTLKERVAANPADSAARRDLALGLDRVGLYSEALEQYLVLEKAGIKSWQLLQNIGNCYFNMDRNSEAISYYSQAIALGGGDADAFSNLGISYRKLKMYYESINVLQQALQKFPDAPYPAFNLGVTFYTAGRKKEARTTFAGFNRQFPALKDKAAPFLKELAAE